MPISAHALFARPLVVAPTSVLAVEVLANTEGSGVLWADGRRAVDLPPGARIEVRRGERPVRQVGVEHDDPFAAADRDADGLAACVVEEVRPALAGFTGREGVHV